MTKIWLQTLFLALLCVIQVACDNNVTAGGGADFDIDPALYDVQIGPLESNRTVYVQIPWDLFVADSGEEGGVVSVYINGSRAISNLDAEQFYSEASDQVIFNVGPISDRAIMGFLLVKSNGGQLYYEGEVDAEDGSVATLEVFDPSAVSNFEQNPDDLLIIDYGIAL